MREVFGEGSFWDLLPYVGSLCIRDQRLRRISYIRDQRIWLKDFCRSQPSWASLGLSHGCDDVRVLIGRWRGYLIIPYVLRMGTALFPTKMHLWCIQLSPCGQQRKTGIKTLLGKRPVKNLCLTILRLGRCVTSLGRLAELFFVRFNSSYIDSFSCIFV